MVLLEGLGGVEMMEKYDDPIMPAGAGLTSQEAQLSASIQQALEKLNAWCDEDCQVGVGHPQGYGAIFVARNHLTDALEVLKEMQGNNYRSIFVKIHDDNH